MKQLLIKHGKEEEETPKGIDRAITIPQEPEKKNEGEGLKEDIFEQLEKLKTNLENTKSRIVGIENQFITLIEEKDKTLNRNLKILDKNCRNNKNVVLMQLSEKDRVLSRIEEKLSYTSELLQNLLKVKSKTPAKRKNLLETAKKSPDEETKIPAIIVSTPPRQLAKDSINTERSVFPNSQPEETPMQNPGSKESNSSNNS